jgi:hypothetical protein
MLTRKVARMAAVGSPAWVATTRGALSGRDQVRFALAAAAREVRVMTAGLRGGDGRVLDSDRTAPDTRLAIGMAELAAGALPAPLLLHSTRTWLWGSMLAEIDGVQYDDELLYVAAMLHDLSLSEVHQPPSDAACFAVHGGAEARVHVLAAGADADFARQVDDAIAAHFNVAVPLSWGAEAHLLHAGAHFDIVGHRLREVAPSTVIEVLERMPRTGLADCVAAAMREEVRLRPRSRAALLQRLGMERSARRAKLPSAVEAGG